MAERPSSSPAARRASAGPPPSTSPSAALTVYATARKPESIEDLEGAGCTTLALDVTDEESMSAAVAAVEEAEGAVGALVNNAGYSQSGAVETVPMDDCAASSRPTSSACCGCASWCCPACAGRARADRQRQLDGRQADVPRAAASTTRPSTRWRRSPTPCASRCAASAWTWSIIEPGLIRTNFAETAVGSVPQEDGPYAEFNTAVAANTAGAYDGPLGKLGGGPEAVAKAIEKAITRAARAPATRSRRRRGCSSASTPCCPTAPGTGWWVPRSRAGP